MSTLTTIPANINTYDSPASYILKDADSITKYLDEKLDSFENGGQYVSIENIAKTILTAVSVIDFNRKHIIAHSCNWMVDYLADKATEANIEIHNRKWAIVKFIEYLASFVFTPEPSCLETAITSVRNKYLEIHHSELAIEAIEGDDRDEPGLKSLYSNYVDCKISKEKFTNSLKAYENAIAALSKIDQEALLEKIKTTLEAKSQDNCSKIKDNENELERLNKKLKKYDMIKGSPVKTVKGTKIQLFRKDGEVKKTIAKIEKEIEMLSGSEKIVQEILNDLTQQ